MDSTAHGLDERRPRTTKGLGLRGALRKARTMPDHEVDWGAWIADIEDEAARLQGDPGLLRTSLTELLGEVGFMRSCIASGEKLSQTDLDRQNASMARATSLLAATPAEPQGDPGLLRSALDREAWVRAFGPGLTFTVSDGQAGRTFVGAESFVDWLLRVEFEERLRTNARAALAATPAEPEPCLNCNGTGFYMLDGARRPCQWDHATPAEPEARVVVYANGRRVGSVLHAADGRWYPGTADMAEHPDFATEAEAVTYLSAEPEAIDVDNGANRIARERERQLTIGYDDPGHDDDHVLGELARAGAVYAIPENYRADNIKQWLWPGWPFKPTPKDRIRELEKAGALIAAEIDRLLRSARLSNPAQRETGR